MKFDIDRLKTIKNYAVSFGVTASYIYKLIKEQKMESIEIDGVQFIDVAKFSKLPTKK
jgi:hypothetical protein